MEKLKRILIVDDEEALTRIIKKNLERTGKFEVETENHGSLVLQHAVSFQPDLVLLDVIMPDREGGFVASELRAHPLFQKLPIIFLTAIISRQEMLEKGSVIGHYPFIAKPVKTEELVSRIETCLDGGPKGSELHEEAKKNNFGR